LKHGKPRDLSRSLAYRISDIFISAYRRRRAKLRKIKKNKKTG
jgi:hypothetical protein